MSENEEKLIEIAKCVLEMNHNIDAKLSGSLGLLFYGFKLRRECNDIDIVCEYLCELDEGFPVVPKGFKEVQMDGNASQVDAIQFKNDDGIKIDFMASAEKGIQLNQISICRIENIINAKLNYSINDLSEESKMKHIEDVRFIFNNNDFTITKI